MKYLVLFLTLTVALTAELFTPRALSVDDVYAGMRAAGVPVMPGLAARHYAEVERKALVGFHADFWWALSKRGLVRHDLRFNCFAISWAFVTEASHVLWREKWSEDSPVWRPAIFPVSYVKADGNGHCLLLVLTNAGPVWWDAQAGLARPLTKLELGTVWYPQG